MKNIIKKYLDNQLGEKESEAFTKLLIRSLNRDQQRQHYKQALLDDWDISRDKADIEPRSAWKKQWLWPVLSVAAIGLLLLALLPQIWTTQLTPIEYADAYLTSHDNYFDDASIRKNGNSNDRLNEFDLAYYEQRYGDVQKIGEELISQNRAEVRTQFFTGLSYLYDGQASRAVAIFQNITASQPDSDQNWREETQWFLAIAFIKAQQIEEARSILINIQVDEWNYQRAQELLGSLPLL